MSFYPAQNPFFMLNDKAGRPVTGGRIYIGIAGMDPEINPTPIYWDNGVTPATQPLQIKGGYVVNGTTPATPFLPATYSIRAYDALGAEIFYAISMSGSLAAQLASNAGAGLVGFSQATNYSAGTVGAKLKQSISPVDKDYGAVANGAADDTTAVNAATADQASRGVNGHMLLTGTCLVTSWYNPYGIKTDGSGKIVKSITGGVQQLNTYSDRPGSHVFGKEYMFRVFQRAALGQSGTTGRIGCFLYGDSTVANGYMSMSTIEILSALFQTRGIGNVAFTNRGVAGTQVSSLNALPDLGTTTDLLIIKYGINDGGNPENTRLATFQSTFDSKLAAIRADAHGSIANLAILLVGPNSTSDTPNGRDERWYEQLHGVYLTLARKYQCCYVDIYGALRDSRGAAGLWQDNPYGDGRAIHPLDSLGFQIWSRVADAVITAQEAVWIGTSNFRNLTSGVYAPINTATPSQWHFGMDHARATVGNGWPIDGFVLHNRNPDGGALQILYPYAADKTKIMVRTANTGGDNFNRWSSAPENLSLVNGWIAAGTVSGTNYATPSAYVDTSGSIHLRGAVRSGTTTTGTKITTLPAGMYPPNDHVFECAGSSGRVAIKVGANGDVTLFSTGDATVTCFDGICFLAA